MISLLLPANRLHAKPQPKIKVAVIEFEVQGAMEIKDAGKIMAEWMITSIGKKEKFIMVERVLLKKILEEDKLILSGVVDEGSAQEIGQKYGVDAIITGAVSKWGDIYTVTVRLIDTFTGEGLKFAERKTKNENKLAFEIDKMADELIRVKVTPRNESSEAPEKKTKKQLQQEKKEAEKRAKEEEARKKKEAEQAKKQKEEEARKQREQEKQKKKNEKNKSDRKDDSGRDSRFEKFSEEDTSSKKDSGNSSKKNSKDRFSGSNDGDERNSNR